MIERTIVFPLVDNEGHSNEQAINQIKGELLGIAGGFSESYQTGVWLDESGTIYQDNSLRICTAVDDSKDCLIFNRLARWCEDLHQLALYTHKTEVQVSFIEPAKQALTA